MHRRLIASASTAVAILALLAVVDTAAATGATAPPIPVSVVPRHDASQPHAELVDVSCATATSCLAVGRRITPAGLSSAITERRGPGGMWRIAPTGAAGSGALTSVSCAGPTCFAVAQTVRPTGYLGQGTTRIVRRSGGHWVAAPMDAAARSRVADVSCAATSWCKAVGTVTGRGTVTWTWHGSRWRLGRIPHPHLRHLTAVSCDSTGSCWAAGSRGSLGRETPLVLREKSGRWSRVAVPTGAGYGAFADISCAAGSCVAVGQAGGHLLVASGRGGGWVSRRPLRHLYGANGFAVSCTARSGCTAVVSFLDSNEAVTTAVAYRGRTGPFRLERGRHPALDAVDCRRAHCAVVGSTLLTDRGGNTIADVATLPVGFRSSGRTLTKETVAVPPGGVASSFDEVSCVPGGFCAALDTAGAGGRSAVSLRGAGGRWRAAPSGVGSGAVDIACTSATSCLVVGAHVAWNYDGTGWTHTPLPTRHNDLLVAVACADPSDCDAVGLVAPAGAGSYRPLDLHWNGTTWTRTVPPAPSTGNPTLTDVACPAGGAGCIAVGDNQTDLFFERLGSGAPQLVTGSGGAWRATENRITCWSATGCAIAGLGAHRGSAAASWDGTALTATPLAGQQQVNPPEVAGVSCLAADRCTAVGVQYQQNRFVPLVETYDGHQWQVVATGAPAGQQPGFLDVSCPDGTCTAVGNVYRQFTVALAADYPLG